MNRIKPSTLDEILAISEQMQAGHADSLALGDELLSRVLALPPDRSELATRPEWQRGSKWALVASFENPPDGFEAVPQNIELKHDMVIRGVEAQILLQYADAASIPAGGLSPVGSGRNNRIYGESAFRVDSMQGFQSEGRAEVLERLIRITGDGCFTAPLDWELQQEQTIEVRFRNTLSELVGAGNVADIGVSMRWAVITFWAEDRRPGEDKRRGGR